MRNIDFVPATPELLQRFYGKPLPRTVRALVAVQGDDLLSVFGVFHAKHCWLAFWDYPKTVCPRLNKRAVIKGYRAVLRMVSSSRLPLMAYADPGIERSEDLLAHIGMVPAPHVGERIYILED